MAVMKSFARLACLLLICVPAVTAQTNGALAAFALSDGAAAGRYGHGLAFSGAAIGKRVPVTGLSNAFTFEGWIAPTVFAPNGFWKQNDEGGRAIYQLATTSAGAIYFATYLGNVNQPIV